jgi:hypothetical protein
MAPKTCMIPPAIRTMGARGPDAPAAIAVLAQETAAPPAADVINCALLPLETIPVQFSVVHNPPWFIAVCTVWLTSGAEGDPGPPAAIAAARTEASSPSHCMKRRRISVAERGEKRDDEDKRDREGDDRGADPDSPEDRQRNGFCVPV